MENNVSSSSDDSDLDVDEEDNVQHREKRDIAWCGVEDDEETNSSVPRAVWPPPQQLQPTTSRDWANLRSVRVGNPLYGQKMQLFSRTQYYLAVFADGRVHGTRDESDLHTFLELVSVGPGLVKIKGMLTNTFVGMDKKGRLYAEADPMSESIVFLESFQGSYKTYKSRRFEHLGWYVGIKKSGKFKRGPITKFGQKAIKFLSIRKRFE